MSKKFCINCKHIKTADPGVLVCNHPKLGKHAGCYNVRMIRLIGNTLQNDMMKECFSELCGRKGDWYDEK